MQQNRTTIKKQEQALVIETTEDLGWKCKFEKVCPGMRTNIDFQMIFVAMVFYVIKELVFPPIPIAMLQCHGFHKKFIA